MSSPHDEHSEQIKQKLTASKRRAKREPNNAQAHIDLASVHAHAFRSKVAGKHVSAAAKAMRAAARLLPHVAPTLHVWTGNLMLESSEPARARETCEKALRLDPTKADAYLCLGKCARDAGALESGSRMFALAAELAASNSSDVLAAHTAHADLLRGFGRQHAALDELRRGFRWARTALPRAPSGGSSAPPAASSQPLSAYVRSVTLATGLALLLYELPAAHLNASAYSARRKEAARAADRAVEWATHAVRTEASAHHLALLASAQQAVARHAVWLRRPHAAIAAYREGIDAMNGAVARASPMADRFDQVASEYVAYSAYHEAAAAEEKAAKTAAEAAEAAEASASRMAAEVVADGSTVPTSAPRTDGSAEQRPPPFLHAPPATAVGPPPACTDASTDGAHSNGGWGCAHAPLPPGGLHCSIARVPAAELSASAFYARFATPGLPVVVVGGCADEALSRRWQRSELLAAHGDDLVNVTRSSTARARQYGGAQGDLASEKRTTLREFGSTLSGHAYFGGRTDGKEGEVRRPAGESSGEDEPSSAERATSSGEDATSSGEDATSSGEEDPWYLLTKRLAWVSDELPQPALFERGFELPHEQRQEKALFSLGGVRSGAHFHQHAYKQAGRTAAAPTLCELRTERTRVAVRCVQ
jgi:hypothetical protein